MKLSFAASLALALAAGAGALAQTPPMDHMSMPMPTSGAPAAPPVAGTAVKIDNFAFGPVALVVPVGTTVTWTNRDDAPHTVVANAGAFKSKVLDTDDSFSFTFTTPGEYAYFCSLHPHMTGKVIVEAK